MSIPLKTFIIYARADAPFKDELLTHLHLFVENEFIENWVDSDLLPGEDWEKRIEKELDDAHLVIMLVSADALKSEFIRKKELKTALEKKRDGSARVVPILVRDCYWELHPDLSEIQLLPKDEQGKIRGVASWLSRDSAWVHCLRELHKLMLEIRSHLEKEAATRAREAENEALAQKEQTEKAEKARHRRDEAAWKKIQADAEKTDDDEHKILLFETYLGEQEHLNHRDEAEENLDDLRAALKTARKVEEARKAALQKQQEAAKAAETLRQHEAAEQKEKEAAPPKDLSEMVFVNGGSFQMGSKDRDAEKPVHKVVLSDFEIGKYPVTQKLWQEIMGANPSRFKGDDLPVESVSWDDCQVFLTKLNQKTGKAYRLPTEAEWEYAARGGALSKSFQYAGSNDLHELGWFWENSGEEPLSGEWKLELVTKNNCRTHPVGQKKANELGLHDMSGNVWEWCADWYDASYYKNTPEENPPGPAAGADRVRRGGSWYGYARYCRVAYRGFNSPAFRNFNLGFRLATSPQ